MKSNDLSVLLEIDQGSHGSPCWNACEGTERLSFTGLLFIGNAQLFIGKSFGFGIDQAVGFGIEDS